MSMDLVLVCWNEVHLFSQLVTAVQAKATKNKRKKVQG